MLRGGRRQIKRGSHRGLVIAQPFLGVIRDRLPQLGDARQITTTWVPRFDTSTRCIHSRLTSRPGYKKGLDNMASPPPIPHLNVPRKRSSISSLSGANPHKRRKPSNLRNAFSPDAESVGSPRFSRSPSLDSVATTSVVNGAGGKKRRRKGETGDAGSVAGSSVRGGKGGDGRSVVGGEGEGQDYEEEEDDDDMGEEMGMAMEEGGMTAEDRRKLEKDHERYIISLTMAIRVHY